MVELLVVIAIISLLAAFLLPVIAAATASARRANCSVKEKQIFLGLRTYLNNSDDYLPVAWVNHTPGASDSTTQSRYGYLSYWRFLLHEFCESGYNHLLDLNKETAAEKATRDKLFWTDPAKGYTTDYFSPSILFTGWLRADGSKEIDPAAKAGEADKFDRHTHASQAGSQDVPSTQRPVMTECDAGYPAVAQPADDPEDWKGRPTANDHKSDLQNGWTMAALPNGGPNVLIGVGKSVRTDGDYAKESVRIDFRHNGSCNVLFLDGHVDQMSQTNQALLQRVLDNWNSLSPATTTPP